MRAAWVCDGRKRMKEGVQATMLESLSQSRGGGVAVLTGQTHSRTIWTNNVPIYPYRGSHLFALFMKHCHYLLFYTEEKSGEEHHMTTECVKENILEIYGFICRAKGRFVKY